MKMMWALNAFAVVAGLVGYVEDQPLAFVVAAQGFVGGVVIHTILTQLGGESSGSVTMADGESWRDSWIPRRRG